MPDSESPGGTLTDADLLERSAAGDRAAFDEVVRRHSASVFRLARTLVERQVDAEDLLQQTFLSAWQAARQFRGEASVRTWLLTIARHAAWQLRAKRGREPLDDVPVDQLGLLAGWGQSDPECAAMRNQQRDRVAAAFSALALEDREVLTLRDLEECSGEETASMLELSVAAMKSRLHRARLRLAAELRKEGGRAAQRA